MTFLPLTPGVCSYNGVTFPTETETVEIASRPVPDASGRTVKYVLHAITLKFTVAVEQLIVDQEGGGFEESTDSPLEVIRKRLTAYGGELHYENIGFGNLTINVQGTTTQLGLASGQGPPNDDDTVLDVEWGPKPTLLRWKPDAFNQAAEVTWTVEVRIPECDTASYEFATMEAVYKLSFEIDRSGYTRRVYSGHVSIPQTRATVTGRTLSDQADRLRETINPARLAGFRRLPGTFTLDESKCRLDFHVVDEEVGPNYLPPGAIDGHVSQSCYRGAERFNWTATLSGEWEVSRDFSLSMAWDWFYNLWKRRSDAALNTPFLGGKQVSVITAMSVGEPDVYGKQRAAMSITWTYLAAFDAVVRAAGVWTGVPSNNWAAWNTSLSAALGPRGHARLAFSAADDALIDLCAQGANTPRQNSSLKTPPAPTKTTLRNPYPEPLTSWLFWWSSITTGQVDNIVEAKPLPPEPATPPAAPTGGGGGGGLGPLQGGSYLDPFPTPGSPDPGRVPRPQPGGPGRVPATRVILPPVLNPTQTITGVTTTDPPSVIQKRTDSRYFAILRGGALRAGYPITPPVLLSVGGVRAIQANRQGDGFYQLQRYSWFGVPVYEAGWQLYYILASRPTGDVTVPPTPYEGA